MPRHLRSHLRGKSAVRSRLPRRCHAAHDPRPHAGEPRTRSTRGGAGPTRVDVRPAPRVARSRSRRARSSHACTRGLELSVAVMPMFPLGTVLFPYTSIPLHVFEERYRVMVRELLGDLDAQFGVVLIERGSVVGGGDVRFNVACAARIVEAEEYPDGRFAIAAVGDGRVRVAQWLDDDPYPRAEVEPLAESDATDADFDARARLVDAFADVVDVARRFDPRIVSPPELDPDPLRASFQAGAWAPIGPLDAQRVLETDDLGARLTLLAQLIGERAEELRARLDDGQG